MLTENKFIWQDDYWSVGVSESHIEAVRKYIHNQEEHHFKESYSEDVNKLMKIYGWSFIKEKEQK